MPKYTVHHSAIALSGGKVAKAGESIELSEADAKELPYGTLVELTKKPDLRTRGAKPVEVERDDDIEEEAKAPPAKPAAPPVTPKGAK